MKDAAIILILVGLAFGFLYLAIWLKNSGGSERGKVSTPEDKPIMVLPNGDYTTIRYESGATTYTSVEQPPDTPIKAQSSPQIHESNISDAYPIDEYKDLSEGLRNDLDDDDWEGELTSAQLASIGRR